MTNADLADLLNAKVSLAGDAAITPNVIRQWIAWDVLPKATATGRAIGQSPAWSRSSVGVARATRLAEIRRLGVKRETAVIVQAYIEWGHPDFERVQAAFLHELHKWRSQLARHRTTFIDDRTFRGLSAVQKRAIRVQLGAIDDLFAGTRFQQSDEFVATFAQLAESGKSDPKLLHRLLAEAFDRISPGFGQLLSTAPIQSIIDLMAGALGSPDEIENSAQSEVQKATQREFRIARIAMRRILQMIRQTGQFSIVPGLPEPLRELFDTLNVISAQISIGPWAVFHFTQCLMTVRRGHRFPEIAVNDVISGDLSQILLSAFAMPKP